MTLRRVVQRLPFFGTDRAFERFECGHHTQPVGPARKRRRCTECEPLTLWEGECE